MWKCLVLFVLVQRAILSQPVIPENVREARHLNFEECCPCPSSDRSSIKELNSWSSQIPRDCPCQKAADSDTASSIIRPAMRAVEPFIRPIGTSEPKPLLTPEVGLASSVLETLREVTDQEYQEALARDAARIAIGDLESNSMEKNSPRNIVNIILKPNHGYVDDVIPEASHVHEARCIQPPSKSNGFLENRPQRFRNTLLPLSKATSNSLVHNKLFDMDNSASNIQKQISLPLRSNLLDDLKLKSELLKMKLFPGIGNSLGEVSSPLNIESGKIHNFRLPSLLDNIKIQKENDIHTIPSNTKIMNKHREIDTIESPSNLVKSSNFRNSPQPTLSSINNKFDTSRNNLKMKPTNKNYVSNQLESTLPNNNKEENYVDIKELSDKSECNKKDGIENNDFTNEDHVEISDAASSPSEISEVKPLIDSHEPEIDENADDVVDEETIDNDKNTLDDNPQHTIIEEVLPPGFSEELCEENPDTDQLNSIYSGTETGNVNLKDETLCNVNDIDASPSDNILQTTNLLKNDANVQTDDVNGIKGADELNIHEQRSNNENISTIRNKNIIVDDSRKVSTLPNIKENILKTLENFKKTNEKIQEKLKANVQDALQSFVVKKNPVVEVESPPSTVGPIINDINDSKNSIQITDLQEMSDRILNLSNIKEAEKSIYTLDNANMRHSTENQPSDLKYKDNNKEANNNYMRVSEMDNISEPLKDISPNIKLEKAEAIKPESKIRELEEIDPKTLDEPCVKSTKTSNGVETDTDMNPNEMISEASSPMVSSTHHLAQPKNFNVKNGLQHFKTSITDLFNDQRESKLLPSISDNENDNTLINTIYEKNAQATDNYLARKNKDQRLDYRPKLKNFDGSLNSYKAKIAVPASLNRDTYREIPERTSSFKNLRSQMETLSPINLKTIVGKADKHKDILIPRARAFDTLRNAPLSSGSSNFKHDNVLKNIHDTLELPLRKPIFRSPNNILSKASPREIFGTISKTNNDLNEKFRAFHSELNEKLSSFSQKISDIKPLQLKSEPRFKNIKTHNNLKHTKLPIRGNTSALTAKKHSLKLNHLEDSSQIIDMNKSKLVQKLKSPTQLTLDSKNSPTVSRPTKLKDDVAKLKAIKLKPLKDNKVTITFTTTVRPNLSLKRKSSLNSQSSKYPETKSKLKSNDPKTSASERISSRVPYSDRRSHNEQKIPNYDENASIYDLHDNPTNSEETNGRKPANSLLSKLREAAKVRANGEATRKNDGNRLRSGADDAVSASDINAVAMKDRPLKQNVSYKCKMMCFEDHDYV